MEHVTLKLALLLSIALDKHKIVIFYRIMKHAYINISCTDALGATVQYKYVINWFSANVNVMPRIACECITIVDAVCSILFITVVIESG